MIFCFFLAACFVFIRKSNIFAVRFERNCYLQENKQEEKDMKKDIHPKDYKFVVFKDMSNGYTFMSRSTAKTRETIKWEDGKEYPLVKLEISHTSHPFYTGKMKLVDSAGRVDKFKNKYKKHYEKKGKQ